MSRTSIDAMQVTALRIATDAPEADGTLSWDATTMVLVEAEGGGRVGFGYTYSHTAAAVLIDEVLVPTLLGRDALMVQASWQAMRRRIRNLGRPGLVSAAIAAVDVALWDLKARILERSLVDVLDGCRTEVPVYGSGGFTSYDDRQLEAQLGGWIEAGLRDVKMKVGQHPDRDVQRVRRARNVIGDDHGLFVDGNGAWQRKPAQAFAHRFAEFGVSWFEEPVSADDVDGLRLLRDTAPPGMEIAAGEYCYLLGDFRRLLEAGAVDVLQIDATRCQGITGLMAAAAMCNARSLEYSAHTAPTLHGHACCAARGARHVEYFHDHARIEPMVFDGALQPVRGVLQPDLTRPGLGIEPKRRDFGQWLVWQGERQEQET